MLLTNKIYKLFNCLTGIWILILSITAFGASIYYKYDISSFIIKKSLPLTVIGYIYGVLLAIALYIKASRVTVSHLNMYGATNNIIYDFWQGREVNPRIGPLDIKIMLFRFILC